MIGPACRWQLSGRWSQHWGEMRLYVSSILKVWPPGSFKSVHLDQASKCFEWKIPSSRGLSRLAAIQKSSLPLALVKYSCLYSEGISKSSSRNPATRCSLKLIGQWHVWDNTISNKSPSEHNFLESPQYGSPRDVWKRNQGPPRGIFLHKDIASTDPEVLKIHGFSLNNEFISSRLVIFI